jgi:hypothetical protein
MPEDTWEEVTDSLQDLGEWDDTALWDDDTSWHDDSTLWSEQ